MNSYITFCNLHHLDLKPLPDTLSFFISYMACQTGPSGKTISIQTISSYLSGIAHHLEPFYPSIWSIRKHPLVIKTLQGAEKTDGHSVLQKLPIEDDHLHLLVSKLGSSDNFDDHLFLAICFTAYHGLMRLREIVTPDNPKKLNFRKLSLCCTLEFIHNNSIHAFKFNLPTHKADWQYHGNSVIIQSRQIPLDPISIFSHYLDVRDASFSFLPHLWVQQDGSFPSHSWFMHKLHHFLPKEFSGHSFHAGGATHLAAAGILSWYNLSSFLFHLWLHLTLSTRPLPPLCQLQSIPAQLHYVHCQTSPRLMSDLLGSGSHAKGYCLYTFVQFVWSFFIGNNG